MTCSDLGLFIWTRWLVMSIFTETSPTGANWDSLSASVVAGVTASGGPPRRPAYTTAFAKLLSEKCGQKRWMPISLRSYR